MTAALFTIGVDPPEADGDAWRPPERVTTAAAGELGRMVGRLVYAGWACGVWWCPGHRVAVQAAA